MVHKKSYLEEVVFYPALLKKTFELYDQRFCHARNKRKYGETSIFEWKTACQMYFFRILSQKNAGIMNLKNPDLDMI